MAVLLCSLAIHFFVINCYIMTIWPNIFSMNILSDFLVINTALLGIPSPCSLALPTSCDNYIPYYILNYTCHKNRAVINSSWVHIRHASQSTHYREHLMLAVNFTTVACDSNTYLFHTQQHASHLFSSQNYEYILLLQIHYLCHETASAH